MEWRDMIMFNQSPFTCNIRHWGWRFYKHHKEREKRENQLVYYESPSRILLVGIEDGVCGDACSINNMSENHIYGFTDWLVN